MHATCITQWYTYYKLSTLALKQATNQDLLHLYISGDKHNKCGNNKNRSTTHIFTVVVIWSRSGWRKWLLLLKLLPKYKEICARGSNGDLLQSHVCILQHLYDLNVQITMQVMSNMGWNEGLLFGKGFSLHTCTEKYSYLLVHSLWISDTQQQQVLITIC